MRPKQRLFGARWTRWRAVRPIAATPSLEGEAERRKGEGGGDQKREVDKDRAYPGHHGIGSGIFLRRERGVEISLFGIEPITENVHASGPSGHREEEHHTGNQNPDRRQEFCPEGDDAQRGQKHEDDKTEPCQLSPAVEPRGEYVVSTGSRHEPPRSRTPLSGALDRYRSQVSSGPSLPSVWREVPLRGRPGATALTVPRRWRPWRAHPPCSNKLGHCRRLRLAPSGGCTRGDARERPVSA